MAKLFSGVTRQYNDFKQLNSQDKKTFLKELLINNSLYIFMVIAIIAIQIISPKFLSSSSIINIVSLSAANLPIALGIAGCIILTGTDLSAGRIVGLVACVSASLLQASGYANKMFVDLDTLPIFVVLLLAIAIGAIVGFVNGFCVSKFSLHPFIVTLATQLIVYGILLMYLMIGTNNGQSISGLDAGYTGFIAGAAISIGGKGIPNFVWYAVLITFPSILIVPDFLVAIPKIVSITSVRPEPSNPAIPTISPRLTSNEISLI